MERVKRIFEKMKSKIFILIHFVYEFMKYKTVRVRDFYTKYKIMPMPFAIEIVLKNGFPKDGHDLGFVFHSGLSYWFRSEIILHRKSRLIYIGSYK